MKSLGSVIGSLPTSSTPEPNGQGGTVLSTIGSRATAPASILAAIETEDPKAIDKAVVESLPPSLRFNARSVDRTETNEAGEFEGVVIDRYEFRTGRPVEDVRVALAAIEVACQPATTRRLSGALGELALVTKARAEQGEDTTARIGILTRELSEFPSDVALAAIRRRARGYQFFPSLSELRQTCQIIGGKRLALREGLRRALTEAA